MSKNLLRATTTVSSMTFLSRILGFIRDVLVAQLFGTSAAVDAFYIAFKIPNFMRNLFAEGCFSQAFVPVLAEYRKTRSLSETKNFIQHISGNLALFLFLLSLIGILTAPLIVHLFAPGYIKDPWRYYCATSMLRITFPYIFFISLTALASAILNSFKFFAAPAFTPALLNIVFILTAIFLSPHLLVPVMSQAWGVLIAGLVQLSFLIFYLWKKKLLVLPRISFKDAGVNRVLKLMLPALFGASIGQISLLINTIFASFLVVGSVSWLYYSERLVFFPLGVFGVALATVVLPHLSAKHATQSKDDYSKAMDWGLRCNLIIALPAMIYLWVLALPLVISLFGYGHFTLSDASMTAKSVCAYGLGLPAFMLVKTLSAGFYAQQDTRTPVKIGVISIVVTIILNAVLVFPLAHVGLALASCLGSWLNAFLLLMQLRKKNIYHFSSVWKKFILQMGLANGFLAFLLYYLSGTQHAWFFHHAVWRLSQLGLLLGLGGLLYFLILWFLGLKISDYRIMSD